MSLMCLLRTAGFLRQLLGVARSATLQDIRRAFKKLAIEHHPDKRPNDPEAHENFLKLNRAFEVLKSEDLRLKYDKHGEDGLRDDFHDRQGQYQSYNYYRNDFGLVCVIYLYLSAPVSCCVQSHGFEFKSYLSSFFSLFLE